MARVLKKKYHDSYSNFCEWRALNIAHAPYTPPTENKKTALSRNKKENEKSRCEYD